MGGFFSLLKVAIDLLSDPKVQQCLSNLKPDVERIVAALPASEE